MILPTKHLLPERALLSVGAQLLKHLREPMTISRLWSELRRAEREREESSSPVNYDWFVLALSLLYTLGAIEFDQGIVRRVVV